MNRAAVPALPTNIFSFFVGKTPLLPVILTVVPLASAFIPRSVKHFKKVAQSLENCAPYKVLSPLASAAISMARAVMLFEPGTVTLTFLSFVLP